MTDESGHIFTDNKRLSVTELVWASGRRNYESQQERSNKETAGWYHGKAEFYVYNHNFIYPSVRSV
jgi:hypothetical protein